MRAARELTMKPNGVVTFLTDFGASGMYVGAMKGALLSVAPSARIIDISHEISAQAVREASFVGGGAWKYFPDGTGHVAAVDPDVGTDRLPVLVETPNCFFIGPDNGLCSALLPADARPAQAGRIPIPAGSRAYVLSERRYHRPDLSATFHGRDLFAPVAGHVTNGVAASDFGPSLQDLFALPGERATWDAAARLAGSVIYVDHFGNVMTNVRVEDLPPSPQLTVAGRVVDEGVVRTYDDIHVVAGLIGSEGYLELACPRGNAARLLVVGAGAPVVVTAG